MNTLKKVVNKILYPNTHSSKAFIKYLTSKGIEIGEGTIFTKPKQTTVDTQKPEFLVIGNNCCITEGVVLLAHDWSYSVVARVYHDAPAKQRITKIGNNVFIGINSIILMGANIGDNVIIGAGSVVNGKVDSNSVYAGNPAVKIHTLDEHYKKIKDDFENSALITVKRLQEKYNSPIRLEDLGIYTSLFVEKTDENMEYYFKHSSIKDVIRVMQKKYLTIDELVERGGEKNE